LVKRSSDKERLREVSVGRFPLSFDRVRSLCVLGIERNRKFAK